VHVSASFLRHAMLWLRDALWIFFVFRCFSASTSYRAAASFHARFSAATPPPSAHACRRLLPFAAVFADGAAAHAAA